jgi:hypothetical protein
MADIINFPWIRNPDRRNVDLADYPNVKRWHDAVAARPAVQRGVEVLSDKKKLGPHDRRRREITFGKTKFLARWASAVEMEDKNTPTVLSGYMISPGVLDAAVCSSPLS